jgi:catechol 2,3-dioxygenase-like lactoylglutathione lyase family enzyme
MDRQPAGGALHHVEIWVPDLRRAVDSFGWLLGELGYAVHQDWAAGRSWRLGEAGTYVVVEQSPALTADRHERTRPGLNHLAFRVAGEAALDALVAEAPRRGWRLLFGDRHPYAGGSGHYAAYLENTDGFEVELVALPG